MACVYGSVDGIRIGWHIQDNLPSYSVAFAGDATFYEVRGLCEGQWKCAYAAGTDVMIAHRVPNGISSAVMYKNVSKHLKKRFDVTTLASYFSFESSEPSQVIGAAGTGPYAKTMALSRNGEWGVVELPELGVVRVNLKTGEHRRVLTEVITYPPSIAVNPELAISNDGRYIVVAGENLGLNLYEVGDFCGDMLHLFSTKVLSQGATPCQRVGLDYHLLFPNFSHAHLPRFIAGGARLSVLVTRHGREGVFAVIDGGSRVATRTAHYLALGDSFTSGEGETDDAYYRDGTNIGVHKCHHGLRSYPYLLGRDWGKSHASVACSGAQTIDIRSSSHYLGQGGRLADVSASSLEVVRDEARVGMVPGIIPQVEFVRSTQPKVITIGIGGNDAGLMGKLASCVTAITCEWARDKNGRRDAAREIQAIEPLLRSTYREVRAEAAGAALYAIGYPSVINTGPTARCGFVLSAVLNEKERVFLDESVTLLNQVVQSAAAAEGVPYITIEDALIGARLCDEGTEAGIRAIRLGDDIAPLDALPEWRVFGAESFHPTPEGHRRIAATIRERIAACGSICLGQTQPVNEPLSAYWLEADASPQPLRQTRYVQARPAIAKGGAGQTVELFAPPYSFAPGKVLSVTSELAIIGTDGTNMVADSDGSVFLRFTLPSVVRAGAYTVHVTGDGYINHTADVYQVVQVAGSSPPPTERYVSPRITESVVANATNTLRLQGAVVGAGVLGATSANKNVRSKEGIIMHKNLPETGGAEDVSSQGVTLPMAYVLMGAGAVVVVVSATIYYKQRYTK